MDVGDHQFRRLELNGGRVTNGQRLRLQIPVVSQGYTDAQIDDYGGDHGGRRPGRRHYPWRPDVTLHLRARFSHPVGEVVGTAGFGFWNAPFGDPTVRWPALPQTVWFFYGSAPTDLPLAGDGPGRGWFAATLDATMGTAVALAPLAPLILLVNQIAGLRRRVWPLVQRGLGISYAPIQVDITRWHEYNLVWSTDGCRFSVDGDLLLQTPHSPRGPLGFVCWLDNQYLVATRTGRFAWGVLPTLSEQWLEIAELDIKQSPIF
ncbi:MAG TPA: hypothetical protein VF177_03845 [Anaerolineae bacterium]